MVTECDYHQISVIQRQLLELLDLVVVIGLLVVAVVVPDLALQVLEVMVVMVAVEQVVTPQHLIPKIMLVTEHMDWQTVAEEVVVMDLPTVGQEMLERADLASFLSHIPLDK